MNNKLNKEIQSIKQLVSEMPDVITSEWRYDRSRVSSWIIRKGLS